MKDALKTAFFIFSLFFMFFPCSLLNNLFASGKVKLLYQKKISDDPLRGREYVHMNIAIADLLPDGGLAILTHDNKFLFVFDGVTGKNLWSHEIGYSHSSPVIDDVNQDGSPEIIVGNNDGSLYVLNFYEKKLKKSVKIGQEIREIIVSDVNNDGIKDIGVLGREEGRQYYYFLLIDGRSFAVLLKKRSKKEQIFWQSAFVTSASDTQLVVLNEGNRTRCYDASTGKEQWTYNHGTASYFFVRFAKQAMAIASIKETEGNKTNIVIGSATGEILIFNTIGKILRKADIGGSPLGNVGFIDKISTGDLNADSYPDIIASSIDHNVYAVDGKTMKLLWKYKTGDEVYSSPALGDMNNDRYLDVVVISRDSYVYCIDGKDGKLIWKYGLPEPRQPDSAMLADVNSDGFVDVIVGSRYGTLTVLTTDSRCEKGTILWGKEYGNNRNTGEYGVK